MTRLSAGDDKRALNRYTCEHARTHTQQHVRVRERTCVCVDLHTCMRDLSDMPCMRSSPENVSSIAHCVSGPLCRIRSKRPPSMGICAETLKRRKQKPFVYVRRNFRARMSKKYLKSTFERYLLLYCVASFFSKCQTIQSIYGCINYF